MDHVTRPIEILFNLQIFRFFYVSYISMIRMIENLKSTWKSLESQHLGELSMEKENSKFLK